MEQVADALVRTLVEYPRYLDELAVEKNWLTVSLDLIIDDSLRPRLSELHAGCHALHSEAPQFQSRLLSGKWGYTPHEVKGWFQAPLRVALTDHLQRAGREGLDVAACDAAVGSRAIKLSS